MHYTQVLLTMALLRWILFIVTMNYGAVCSSPLKNRSDNYLACPSVQRFRQYLQIDTSKPENIKCAVNFLRQQARELDLKFNAYTYSNGTPVVVITVEGTEPSLPSIMLNSHMDVVTADETEWDHPPFAAYMDKNGDIFARGAQDTKDVGIQYLEAVRRMKKNNVTLLRTLHLTYMPDEETGGYVGIKKFVDTEEFRSLNVGFALDEGMTSTEDELYVTYVDRRPWQIEFVVYGEGGHGFTMPDDTAVEKVVKLLNIITDFRHEQIKILKSTNRTDYGAYTSININILKGGYAPNIIPTQISVVTDMRLSTGAQISDVENFVNELLRVSGNGTKLNYIRREDVSGTTQVDNSNVYWVAIKQAVNELGYQIEPIVGPATSDMLVVRNLGIPALGFSAKTHTVSRIHGKNEYLNVKVFLKGIDIYVEVIKNLGNLPGDVTENRQNHI